MTEACVVSEQMADKGQLKKGLTGTGDLTGQN